MTDEYVQYIRISSTDGSNTVESMINNIKKKCSKGQVEFGVDVDVERVTLEQIAEAVEEDFE